MTGPFQYTSKYGEGFIFPRESMQFDEIIQELVDADIIKSVEGSKEWISNVVLTQKTDSAQLRTNEYGYDNC